MKSQLKCHFLGGKTKDSTSISNQCISKGYVYFCNSILRSKGVNDSLHKSFWPEKPLGSHRAPLLRENEHGRSVIKRPCKIINVAFYHQPRTQNRLKDEGVSYSTQCLRRPKDYVVLILMHFPVHGFPRGFLLLLFVVILGLIIRQKLSHLQNIP